MITFITAKEQTENGIYFRKKFNIEGPAAAVCVRAAAVGIFKGYVNGAEMADDVLSPGWTDYRKRIPVYTYDLTDKVRQGENCVGFVAGNGWGVGKIAWFGKHFYADSPLLYCEIVIDYADGRTERIPCSAEFRCTQGEVRGNDLLDGETDDKNFDLGDFTAPDYDDSDWEPARETAYDSILEPAIAPLTKKHETFAGKLLDTVNDWRIYDFGQNHAGMIELQLTGAKKGDRVTVQYGEMRDDDGSVYVENLRTAKCIDTFLCRDGRNEFQPLFTFHGYRYAGVKVEGKAKIEHIQSRAVYSDLAFTSEFCCSDSNVNRLYQNILWGQKSNFINLPTDCPQRDERLGWTGDAQVFCRTAMYNSDTRMFYKKYMQDMRDAQLSNGMTDVVAPSVETDFNHMRGSAAWGDAIVILPYEYYLFYGDETVLRENIDAAKRWVQFCVRDSDGYIRPALGYGDWLSVEDDTDLSVLATLFLAGSARLVYRMCHILGDADEQEYRLIYEKTKEAFIRRFVGAGDVIASDTQTCYLLAYQFGILPKERMKDNLLRTIRRKNNHLSTGFIGVRFLLPTLTDLGEIDLAYELLTRTDYPSWCYTVVNGASTIWERWNSYEIGKGFADRQMNSFNHYSLGSVGEWIFSRMLGIRLDEEGKCVKPVVDTSGKITWAKGTVDTVCGRVFVAWRVENGKIYLSADYPEEFRLNLDAYDVLEKNGSEYILEKKKVLAF